MPKWWPTKNKKHYVKAEAPKEETDADREERMNLMFGAMSWAQDRRGEDDGEIAEDVIVEGKGSADGRRLVSVEVDSDTVGRLGTGICKGKYKACDASMRIGERVYRGVCG